ncbi:hypothetical protein BDP27DRAFT_1338720 [Rhodocollybia butyracea]|uniref:Uncharacterized protein n=1 Tax=Rhodocollybia butyracea TaxID=206335 RepID=A0A9P5U059_9AGAR|nr:hypothetical protein BDP27DRAFT_1338720 [Rhodocollybia butyracea]
MPETEIIRGAGSPGISSKLSADDPIEHGVFIFHEDGCALATGARPTARLHPLPYHDHDFLPLPDAQKQSTAKDGSCTSCTSPTAHHFFSQLPLSLMLAFQDLLIVPHEAEAQKILEDYKSAGLNGKRATKIINALSPTGRMHCAYRGKEIIVGIGQYLIRICFGTEAHCFWLPTTAQYQAILETNLVQRGQKGSARQVPKELIFGPLADPSAPPLLITIAAAFVRPDQTLLFVDHQRFITFHVMRLRRVCSAEDFLLNSPRESWPVYTTQPELTLQVLQNFRSEVQGKQSFDDTPVWQVMKEHQDVCNGFGAQEATDALFGAFIHPQMPISLVCGDDDIWTRFVHTVTTHHTMRVNRVMDPSSICSNLKPLPYVSGLKLFRMNTTAHKLYCADILCYRKEEVYLSREQVMIANSMGLFNPDAVLDDTGIASVPVGPLPFPSRTSLFDCPPTVRNGMDRVVVPNYVHKFNTTDNKSLSMYSPFTCRLPSTWRDNEEIYTGIIDFMDSINDSTLGLYSFRLFTDTAWSLEHISPIAEPLVGNAIIKRPLKACIPSGSSRTLQKGSLKLVKFPSPIKQSSVGITNINDELGSPVDSLVGPIRRVTRSSSRKAKENKRRV